ncbi:hypothetical protein TIFTF001_005579 [Ficus carica]|uniref:Uncharacterized protein n=1 Tax=Ficus carica TaxID=3494 RepID=A0AA87ZYJ0_FICCA|nr:hypothetical protein TIFTF001_005579 [Ficus carica]
MIEAFLDPIRLYSGASWPPLKQAADFYCSCLSLVVHLFPLLYHDNAFVVSCAVNMGNASATLPMLEEFFKHQYEASRGVYGTPSFFLNGFYLHDAGASTDFTGWTNFIDPLIAASD